MAARLGGGDIEANPRLRSSVQTAKDANMPLDNIKRAIMKGTGELPGQSFETVTYEGYGPGGVAVIVEALTDNKNRTVAEVRYIFSKQGGNLGESGSVLWMFDKKGYVAIDQQLISEEKLLEVALEAGAEDLQSEGDSFSVYTSFESLESVRQALETAEIPILSAEVTMIPQSEVRLEGKQAERMLRLMEALEDHDDVQSAYANFDIGDTEMEALASS